MEVCLYGAAKTVTGSCYSIVTKNEKILVDCGLFQGGKDIEKMNYEDFPFDASKYDALVLTHAHLDHCGRIPKLVKYGFRGKIYATNATKELAFIILMDAAKIAAHDTEKENERRAKEGLPKRKPLYNIEDVKIAMKLFKKVSYDVDFNVTKNIVARYYNAGHILGAASIRLEIKDKNESKILAFSGDLGNETSIIVQDKDPIKKADYVFIESTYGDRLHEKIEDRNKEFLRIINETYKRGGKLLIPSFAVERAQELIFDIANFQQEGLMPKIKVYLDSPMAIKATNVFSDYPEYYNKFVKDSMKKRDNPFSFPNLIFTETVKESKLLNDTSEPCIIIAGSGMCNAGRIKHHIKNNIENPQTTLLFVGYQARGTLGYWIKKGEKVVKLLGGHFKVNAKIESIDGFSAHADYLELISWLKNYSPKPKKVFICHGEEEQAEAFSKRVQKEGMKTYIPSMNEKLEL